MSLRDIYERGFDEESGKHLPTETRCPECEGPLHTEGGETTCDVCGLVVDEYHLDHGARQYSDPENEETKRTGAPLTVLLHDRGLMTEMGRYRDARENTLPGAKRMQLGRLRREHTRAKWQTKRERNLAHALGQLSRLGSTLDLPVSVVEAASTLYRQAHEEDLIQGRSIETISAGCVYTACRQRGVIRQVSEIADATGVSENKVRLGCRVLSVELGVAIPFATPREYVPQLASECGVSQEVRRRALDLAEMAEETGIANGREPKGVAAACLYVAGQDAGERVTQSVLAAEAGVSTATVRARYTELRSGQISS